MVPNSFLVILFSIIIIFPSTISQGTTLDDYYNGDKNGGSSSSNGGEDLEDNDCLCDINPSQCDFHCCCDENCPNDAIEDWENHSKCINEQNTPRLSDDKCVDINLFPTWYYNSSKEYPRRGIHLEKQTEDIPKKSAVITNLCFSIDNSKSNDIKTLDDLEKYGYKNIDKLYDDIFNLYIEPYFIRSNKEKSNSGTGTAQTLRRTDETNTENGNDNRITIENNNNKFFRVVKNIQYFSLYSGTNCENTNIVENWSPKNYSCLMKKSENLNVKYFKNKIKLKNVDCDLNKGYKVKDKLLSEEENLSDDLYVLQAEFILIINPQNSKFEYCKINLVAWNEDNTDIDGTFIFKNSVIFTNNKEDPFIPYAYSGNIGYLNGYPLKIYVENEKMVLNDFYIIGRDKDGNCRQDKNLLSYLYSSDKPLLFNEDYTYSCILPKITTSSTTISLKDTILYQKLNSIQFVAKYGSSDYNKVDGNEDWIKVTKINFEDSFTEVSNKIFNIEMNIKFKTDKKKGFYSHRYINEFSIKVNEPQDCSNTNNCYAKLEIKFSGDDENNDTKYTKKPDTPFFIPNIPDDILDPFINPDVDK